MSKTFSSIYRSLRTTPFFGRTLVVLSFFFLLVKQFVLLLSYGRLLEGVNSTETLTHYLWYFVSDFLVCLIILWLVIINTLIKKTLFKLVNNILISWIFLLFVLDIFTMYFFQSRISILDIKQFVTPSLGNFSWLFVGIIIIVCIISIVVFLIVQRPRFKKRQKSLLAIYFSLFTIGCIGFGMYSPWGLRSIPDNIISLNISAIIDQFSDISENNMPDIYEKFFTRKRWYDHHPNIILLFAESLSPIDSLRVGKVNNNLPYFDFISKQGITFTNFVNNGCTSDTSHIATLLWTEPIKLFWYHVGAYSGFKHYTESIPNFFNKQWYSTTFISAVDIDFLGQKQFLFDIWFSQIIGDDTFSWEDTYVFWAAADHSLYQKTMETIKQQTWSYFITLQNISFHKPYNTPYGKTETDALRYADKSLFYFYLQLKKSWFFKNGILVIVADHRKMEELKEGEKTALWDYRYARGLATIVGTWIAPGTINNNIIQHTDIFYSLKQFTSKGIVTISKIFNDVFSFTKKRDRWIVYCRYFQKNNKYTIVQKSGNGMTFNDLSEIIPYYPLVYKYLSSYIIFQRGTGAITSGNSSISIIAHQWSPLETPENSLAGFQLAKKNGAQGVEMDVSYTKDNHLVVLHGEYMRATSSCQKKKVGNHDLAYIKNNCLLKNGEHVRTLEEMLKAIDGMFDSYFIDIKVYDTKDAEQQVNDAIAIVQQLGMQDRVILSSYDKTANYALWSYKNIIAAWDTFDIGDLSAITYINHQYFMTPYTNITGTIAQEVEDLGKRLVVYTVNTTGDIQRLYNLWVRMIMTDNVPLLKTWTENYLSQ